MSQALLWVADAADTGSASRNSARRQEAQIRRHVQENRRRQVTAVDQSISEDAQVAKAQPLECVNGVPATSLRPNRSLGRLASGPAGTAANRKRKTTSTRNKKGDSQSGNAVSVELDVALTKSLPWRWAGQSSTERRSLAFFQLRTSQEWSGWRDSHFWNVLALQVSQQSQGVARSLIALSALHERMEALGSVERQRLQHLSYEQSSKATAQLLAVSKLSYFEALVSCLIMICFHGLQRNPASAFVLLRSGTKLLHECGRPEVSSWDERQVIDKTLRPLFDRLIFRHVGMGDPGGSFALSAERYRANKPISPEEAPAVPPMFSTLEEARHGLQQILDWAHDHVPAREGPTSSLETFLSTFLRLRDAWAIALSQSNLSHSKESSRSLKLLKAASIFNAIIVEMVHCSDETAYDKYLADFEEMMSLVEAAKLVSHSFGIDAGLLDIVAFTGTKCRDPHIRRRALRLLRSQSRLEGDRIASNPATILEALITLEERGLNVDSCHDVPGSSRRHLVCGQQHVAQRRIDLFYASADGSVKERCSVSLAGATGPKLSGKPSADAYIPDAIFGAGYASYLQDRQTGSYFRLELDRFYFYIPKV